MDIQRMYKSALIFAKHLKDAFAFSTDQNILIGSNEVLYPFLESIGVDKRENLFVRYIDELSPEILENHKVFMSVCKDKESILKWVKRQSPNANISQPLFLPNGICLVSIDYDELQSFFKKYLIYEPYNTWYYNYRNGVLEVWSDDKEISSPTIFDFRKSLKQRIAFEIFFDEFHNNGCTELTYQMVETNLKKLNEFYKVNELHNWFEVVRKVNEIKRKYKDNPIFRKQIVWSCDKVRDRYQFKIIPFSVEIQMPTVPSL